MAMLSRFFLLAGPLLAAWLLYAPITRANTSEQTFDVPLGQYFVLDQHGGPGREDARAQRGRQLRGYGLHR